MTLPTSGVLSLTNIQTEFGGTNPINLNEYYAGGAYVRAGTSGTYGAIPSSGTLSVYNFYGARKGIVGVDWTYRAGLAAATASPYWITSITWTGTQFCAIGYNAKAATSPDGITWTSRPGLAAVMSGSNYYMQSIVWTGTQFFAAGDGGRGAASPDGITWTSRPGLEAAMGSFTIEAIVWTGSQFCAVGGTGYVATSADSITWTSRRTDVTANSGNLTDIVWTGTQFCVTCYKGVLTSPDGITWTSRPGLTAATGGLNWMESIVWTGSHFCVVSASGRICAISLDGITWSSYTIPYNMRDIVWTGTQFCAVGLSGAATSPDGVTWTPQQQAGSLLISIAWTGTILCGVGRDGTAYTSP